MLEYNVRVRNEPRGYISHYHHFIVDFLTAFHRWYMDHEIEKKGPCKIKHFPRDRTESLAHMIEILREIYPNTVFEEATIGASHIQFLPNCVRSWDLNWKGDWKYVSNLIELIKSNPKTRQKTWKPVILIKRDIDPRYNTPNAPVPPLNHEGRGPHLPHTTGSQRRVLRCFDEVQDFLIKKFGEGNVAVLKLEHMKFMDQVRYFSQARLVVGEGGAGLTNIMWCPNNGKTYTLEYADQHTVSRLGKGYFSSLANQLNIKYKWCHNTQKMEEHVKGFIENIKDIERREGIASTSDLWSKLASKHHL